jgi:hypothetical protein
MKEENEHKRSGGNCRIVLKTPARYTHSLSRFLMSCPCINPRPSAKSMTNKEIKKRRISKVSDALLVYTRLLATRDDEETVVSN